jgi:sarcosine oxidase subunit gamma
VLAVTADPGLADPAIRHLRRSPLTHRADDLAAVSGGVALAELPFLAMVNLRVDPASEVGVRVEQALGVRLPGAGRVASVVVEGSEGADNVDGGIGVNGGIAGPVRSVLWLGPDEWLVVGPDGDTVNLVSRLNEAVAGGPGSVVDVSANRDTLVISGPNARELLEKGCTLDLHPRVFGAGQCAQTTFARGQVLLWQTGNESAANGPAYRLLFRGSFADYFADWLIDAALEFGSI